MSCRYFGCPESKVLWTINKFWIRFDLLLARNIVGSRSCTQILAPPQKLCFSYKLYLTFEGTPVCSRLPQDTPCSGWRTSQIREEELWAAALLQKAASSQWWEGAVSAASMYLWCSNYYNNTFFFFFYQDLAATAGVPDLPFAGGSHRPKTCKIT